MGSTIAPVFSIEDEEKQQPTPKFEIADAPPTQPGFGQRLRESLGIPSWEQMETQGQEAAAHPIRSIIEGFPPVQAARGIYDWGKRAVGNISEGLGEEKEAGQDIAAGQPILPNLGKSAYGIAHGGIGSLPFIGEPMETAAQDVVNKNYPGAAGGLTGVTGMVAAPELARRAPGAVAAVNRGRAALAEKMVSPLVYENVGETGADIRTGITPEKGITQEGLMGGREGILKQSKSRVTELKNAADNILQNHPNASRVIDTEPLIDGAIDDAIKQAEKVAGGTERLEALRTALKTKYGKIQGTPYEINNLKTDIQKAANRVGAYRNTQPVEGTVADAMKDTASRIRAKVNELVPEAADLNNRMANSIDAQAGLQKGIAAQKGRSIFGGFHEGTTSTMLNRTLGSAPVRTGLARGLMTGLTEGVPPPMRATPFEPAGLLSAPVSATPAGWNVGESGPIRGGRWTTPAGLLKGANAGLLPEHIEPRGVAAPLPGTAELAHPEMFPQELIGATPERTIQRGLGGRMQRVYLGTSKPRIVGWTADGGPIYEK